MDGPPPHQTSLAGRERACLDVRALLRAGWRPARHMCGFLQRSASMVPSTEWLRPQDKNGAAYAVEVGTRHRPTYVGLDGKVEALQAANQLAGLSLTVDMVAFYVHVFCG